MKTIQILYVLLIAALWACSSDNTQAVQPVVLTESQPLGTQQIFPRDNPWNTDISQAPLHPQSKAFMAAIGLDRHVHADFGTEWDNAPIGIPYVLVGSQTPHSPVFFEFAEESDQVGYPIPSGAPIEGGPDSDGDRHLLIVDTAEGKLYELYSLYPDGSGWRAGSGAVFDLNSNALRPAGYTSADAAGLPIFPGLARFDEVVLKGELKHALRFTTNRTQRAYITPATHQAGASSDTNLPPMGLRVRLRASFDTAGYSPEVRVILQGLKTYGLMLADNGSPWYISGAPDPRWNDEHLHELDVLSGSDFEAVYTGETILPDTN